VSIELLNLKFTSDYFYIEQKSIVEKITFNNRTFYSKFKKCKTPLTPILETQHFNHEITLAVSLVEDGCVNYIVIEYHQKEWNAFYSLVKHLLKSLDIDNFQAYYDDQRECFQLFIPRKKLKLELAYQEVETIQHLLEVKSNKSYKIYPNNNLPENFNIITLPTKKI
jgi:hypothetical protein